MTSFAKRRPGLPATAGLFSLLQLALAQAYAGPLVLSQSPLFLTSSTKANVLMMYGNSNSMDSDPSGKAVGSANASSKSEVARAAIKSVVNSYAGFINMGLMAYQQNPLTTQFLHDSQYDVSFDPANYDPAFTGARNSATKKFRIPNPSSPGNFIHFNVNLPYYAGSNQGSAACFSTSACTDPAHDFKGSGASCSVPEHPVNGPWDSYACYKTKTGTSDQVAVGGGYSDGLFNGALNPTDSDLGQGITDFGKRLTWQMVSLAWFNNTSPGMGYLHVPVADLTAAHAARILTKLGTSQFGSNKPVDPAWPLQNAGLSPLEGTVLSANNYFAGALSQASQGGPAAAPPNSCSKNFLITLTDGLPSVSKDGVASANVTANLAALTSQVAALKASASKTETYVVGFALPYGVSITQLDTIAQAGGSGSAYNASDPATLNKAFANIFADIIAKTSAASAVALNSQAVAAGAHVYQAKFSSGDWSGQLLDYGLGSDGSLVKPAVWDAGQKLNSQAPADRVILTGKPQAGGGVAGIAFRWPAAPNSPSATEMTKAQSTWLSTNSGGTVDGFGSDRLDYLRGSAANEGTAGRQWRKRPTSKLGDIVNSAPHYVGVPAANYGLDGYASFRSSVAARSKMIYVGANDGMLHGFDAASGIEKLAYVPSALYPQLSKLTDPSYAHRYYVDGSPNAGDAFYGAAWHTVLVSGMGAGGRGIVALDVTRPANFSEANAASLLNFEFGEADDADVGYIGGQVSIVKMNNGKWAALFGNGYNSGGSGESALFVVDIQSGALIAKIRTGEGSAATPNALAAPLAIDADNDVTVDAVYAGDLLGNMWKFDLSDANPNKWKVAYKLFKAPQPITAAPDAGEHPKGGYMVYFGTGKYIEPGDVGSAPGNAMYGIWDKGATVAGGLLKQEFAELGAIGGKDYRTATARQIDWSVHNGWYAEFPGAAERVISEPILRDGRVIFTSIIPSSTPCTPGGSSWLNEVDWLSGGLLVNPPFDTNNDGVINSADTRVQGRKLDSVASAPAIQRTPDPKKDLKLLNESSGEVTSVTESANPNAARRLSWRQIK
jgi:type IV pilus assembly protein PilY1